MRKHSGAEKTAEREKEASPPKVIFTLPLYCQPGRKHSLEQRALAMFVQEQISIRYNMRNTIRKKIMRENF